MFGNYPGYRETRYIPDKQVAFVEFDTDHEATQALNEMNNFTIEEFEITMKVSYAAKE